MMNPLEVKSPTEQKYWHLCAPIVQSLALEIFDLEFIPRSSLLRLYIYNPTTKTALLEDCAKVDAALTPEIEKPENSWIPESLLLEVSSPGLTRKLKWPYHYKFAIGERVSLQYVTDTSKIKKIVGILEDFRQFGEVSDSKSYQVVLSLSEKNKSGTEQLVIPMENIKKGNLDPLF